MSDVLCHDVICCEETLRLHGVAWDGKDHQSHQTLFYMNSKLVATYNKSYNLLTIHPH